MAWIMLLTSKEQQIPIHMFSHSRTLLMASPNHEQIETKQQKNKSNCIIFNGLILSHDAISLSVWF